MTNLVVLFSVWIYLSAYHNVFLFKRVSFFYNNSLFLISDSVVFCNLAKEIVSAVLFISPLPLESLN